MSGDLNWPDRPGSLPPSLPPVDPFPFELLPDAFRGYVRDEATRMQAAPEMVATALMVAAGSVVGRACGIRPKRIDSSWVEVPNIWGMIIAPPSAMKSPSAASGIAPLLRVADEEMRRYEQESLSNSLRVEILQQQIAHLKKTKNPDIDELQRTILAVQDEIDALTPRLRRFVTSDATVEKIGELLRDNPRGLLVHRDELAGLLRQMEKPERAADRAFYLESWSGHGTFTVDRIGRGTIHIRGLCLSLFGTTQPNKILDLLVRPAVDGGSGDDGFLQRFSMVVWPEISREWSNIDRAVDAGAREKAFGAFARLAELDPNSIAAQPPSAVTKGIPTLGLTDSALAIFNDWLAETKQLVRSPALDPWPGYAAHLEKFTKLVPAIALIGHLVDCVSGYADPGDVSDQAMARAAAWAEFLTPHARRLYGVELDPGRAVLPLLVRRIVAGDIEDGMLFRDLQRKCWQGLAVHDHLRAGIEMLEELGWVRLVKEGTEGRAKQIIKLHPLIINPAMEDEAVEEAPANREFGAMEGAAQ